MEEPLLQPGITPRLTISHSLPVTVVTPELPEGLTQEAADAAQRDLIDELLRVEVESEYLLWYYTPLALAFTDHLTPLVTVYDCMDELSAFRGASPILKSREAELMRRAALVLTGGQSLYEAKRDQHPNIHPFPSSVDVAHFSVGRRKQSDPSDQASIPHPRLGFFGVIDERLDTDLIAAVATARPDWHIVLVGPIVKIDPLSLPQGPNIHYLGSKRYEQLPEYIAGWDVALLPFARNEATRYISPTKTPEYMAAGKPIVSTSIRDVVRPYGQQGLVRIADDPGTFVRACAAAMTEDELKRTIKADAFLRQTSWEGTWSRIKLLLEDAMRGARSEREPEQVPGDAAAV